MKKHLAILAIAILGVYASTANAQDIQAGVKLGANVSKINGKAFDKEFRFGYQLGFFARIDLSETWGIQPELLWNSVKTKVGTNLDTLYSFNNLGDISLDYLTIPLLVNYSPIKPLSLQAGPQFGILVNPHQTTLENGRDAFTNGDISMLFGAQVNVGPIKGGIRYSLGLNNLNELQNQDEWKNQAIQLYIGYTLF